MLIDGKFFIESNKLFYDASGPLVDVLTAIKLKRDGPKLRYKFREIQLWLKGKHGLPPKVTTATMGKTLPANSSGPGSLAEDSKEPVTVPGVPDLLSVGLKLLVSLFPLNEARTSGCHSITSQSSLQTYSG